MTKDEFVPLPLAVTHVNGIYGSTCEFTFIKSAIEIIVLPVAVVVVLADLIAPTMWYFRCGHRRAANGLPQ
ncbi:MAG TPA: hypothetical protein VGF97_09975 [Rhizomicrobium sp.]|jgi:hypothetical protein